jgi:BlaI family transcriptional regulator, penicillinase repressor
MPATKATEKRGLTPLELEIMQVLWSEGASTASEVLPRLKGELAYNTVQTMLQVLLKKGKVKRVAEGRAFRYRAIVSRERAASSAVADLAKRMFDGSGEAMLAAMIAGGLVSPDDLKRARKGAKSGHRSKESED